MTTQISTILRQSLNIKTPNILTTVTHSGYETNLAKSDAVFYSLSGFTGINGGWDYHNRPCPDNYHVLGKTESLPLWLDLDIVLAQQRWGSYQILIHVARNLNLPLIALEHTLPNPNSTQAQFEEYHAMLGDVNVFISEFSRDAWGFTPNNSIVIRHGVDTNTFTPSDKIREPFILSVVNDWKNRDWCCGYKIWERVTQGLPVYPVGDTKGLSVPARDIDELVNFYQRARVFINTSTVSPVPSALLEAMSCGCACVSTATCMIPEFIIDGYNGFITNDEEQMREKLILLLNNPKLAEQLGNNARKTIEDEFSIERFANDWTTLFKKVLR